MVPHLVTALKGPLLALERRFLEATPQIERWFRLEWQERTPPFYCSTDLRNAGFKLAPVDTNLFPGGFNNLSEQVLPLAIQAAMVAVDKYCPEARNLLMIAEDRLEQSDYRQNLLWLAKVLRQTGLEVRIGSLDPALEQSQRIDLSDGQVLVVEPVRRHGRRIVVDEFNPCTVLLNDDLSQGVPQVLRNAHEQTVLPPLHASWSVRRKSTHFGAYREVARRFAKAFQIDPWLIDPGFSSCGQVDFTSRDGEDCLIAGVESVLRQMRSKYREYKVNEKPFVIIKADAGTRGMGVLSVRSVDDVRNLSAAQRELMAVGEDGLPVTEVIVQEGVPTFETINDAVAEPVVYMIDRYVVGGFYRVHAERGPNENLNAPGMSFVPLPFASSCNLPDAQALPEEAANRFYAYGVVARLALLAASIELERTDPDQSLYG